MKIRPHRGGLAESLGATEEIEPTKEAISEWDSERWPYKKVSPDEIDVIPYPEKGRNYDQRTGWHNHVVMLPSWSHPGEKYVAAWTDGPVEK